MKTSLITSALGVLALLGSSVGSAATVTVTSSNLNPVVGDLFTVTLTATFSAGENVGAGTLDWTWDLGKATIQHSLANAACAACLTGSTQVGAGSFIVLRSDTFDVLPGAPPIVGTDFGVAKFDFLATAAGALNLIINDDGGIATGWFDNDTADVVAVQYTQANIVVSEVPAPAAVWLLGTGIAGLVVRRVRRSRAAA